MRANAQRACIMVLHRATQQPSASHVSHAQKPVELVVELAIGPSQKGKHRPAIRAQRNAAGGGRK